MLSMLHSLRRVNASVITLVARMHNVCEIVFPFSLDMREFTDHSRL